MIIDTLNDILGKRADPETAIKIKKLITEEPEVRGAYDLFINNYGPDKNYASVHIELPDTMTVEEVDILTRRLQRKLLNKMGVILTGVGVYSYNTQNDEIGNIRNNIMEKVKTLIIGSGPAGYTAAIYAGRAGLNPVLYSGMQPGGQLTITTEVENFPGYPNGVDGTQMMMDMKEQAARFGADLRDGSISKVDFSSRPYHLTDERGNEIEADTVIIATGASAKYLGLADEEKYRGQGVSACATCDGFFYRKRTVAVVGGGDTACEEAMYLSGLAKKVYMIVRKPYLRASEIMQKRVKEKENIEILFETNTLGLFGENGVEGAHLVRHMGEANEEKFDIAIDGFFLAIGHKPNTDLFKDFIDLDEQGFIKVVPGTASTNLPGIFAAGDVADPVYRQGIVAAGSGAKAAIEADRYLQQL